MVKQSYKLSTGVTLLEMMVALLILSIGLLGVATLQARGQQFNQVAYFRTQATFLAYDLMERIRVNPTDSSGTAGTYVSTLDSNNCPTDVNEDFCDGNAKDCDKDALVKYDKVQWCKHLANTLPGGNATIAWNSDDSTYTITIQWQNVIPDRPIETRIWTLHLAN